MINKEYNPTITAAKGGKQLINVISSAAFSGLIVIIIKELTDKEFDATDIQNGIESVYGSILFLTPFVSAAVRMISNFIKKSKN